MNFRSADEIKKELELVEKYKQSGDLAHLGVLYNQYMHLVYGLCLKYLKNREDSQDAVMQIFEKISINLKTHQISNFKSWLYMVSKNYCLMLLRSKQYKVGKSQKDIDEPYMESAFILHHNDSHVMEEDLQLLETCIETLQNEQKTCVKLFYLQKKSYHEIASHTSYELKKVKSFIQNGKRNLKNCIEGNKKSD